jgi:hypothetical protein
MKKNLKSKKRIYSYDVFRGVLVVGMIVYHILTNLTTLDINHTYFRWVSVGFILFLGIILGQFLSQKTSKILNLNLKLLGLFLLGNFALILNLYSIYRSLPNDIIFGDQGLFTFEILLPMILVSAFFLLISHPKFPLLRGWLAEGKAGDVLFKRSFFFAILFSISILGLFWTEFLASDYYYNIIYFLYGLAGLSLGLVLNLDNFKNHFKFKTTNPFYWLNLFFLIFTFLVEGEILGYSLDFLSVFQVMSFYLLFSNIPVLEKNQTLEWLGKQSLLIYIIHIILIKLIRVLFF